MDESLFQEAAAAFRKGRGAGVRVAIIDSGVETSHPALGGLTLADDLVLVRGENGLMSTESGSGTDVFGHGTAIASVIRRLAPEATLGSFRVMNADLRSKVTMIAVAVREAIQLGYHVLNCSFGCADDFCRHVGTFKELTDLAYLRGVHVVAACNNENFERVEWPGHFPTVLTCNMGRHQTDDVYYRGGTLVEFVARGVDEELAWNGGGTKRVSGSSYAAPVLAAYVARLLSVMPEVDPLLAKCLLKRFAHQYTDQVAGPNVKPRQAALV